jgi:hypothetical protein
MREGHAMSIHNPKETKRTPAEDGGGCDVSSCTIRETSSSWNLQKIQIEMIWSTLKTKSKQKKKFLYWPIHVTVKKTHVKA